MRCALMFVAALLLAGEAAAHGRLEKGSATAAQKVARPAGPDLDTASSQWFTETELLDQHGRKHRFYSDLVRGRTVIINLAFASCKTACSPITAKLAEVQRQLGSRVGSDVRLLTITVDPRRDRPEVLRKFASKFNAGEGWYFLTGPEKSVFTVLRKLGGHTSDPENHSTVLLIGNSATGNWLKLPAAAPAEQIADAVRRIDDPR